MGLPRRATRRRALHCERTNEASHLRKRRAHDEVAVFALSKVCKTAVGVNPTGLNDTVASEDITSMPRA